jgi:prepilin signal peptidase PulO-like enzyme (type II secretory pathway)
MTSITAFHQPAVLAVGAAIVAALWATYLATLATRFVEPAVPAMKWWKAALFSAAGAAGLAAIIQSVDAAVYVGFIVPLLVVGSFVDALTMRLPNRYNGDTGTVIAIGTVAAGFYISPFAAFIAGGAGVAALIVFGLLSMVSRGGFGMGDVKLAGVIAAALALIDVTVAPTHLLAGPLGLTVIVLHLMVWVCLSFLFGGVYVAVRLRRKVKGHFPFGPFFAAGWVFAVGATPAFMSILTPFA